MAEEILTLQRELFVVGADLAANPDQRAKLAEGVSIVTAAMTGRLEARIDVLVAERPLPAVFIVPGATPSSAALDVARSTIRRAERAVVTLERDRPTNAEVRRYLNRLSDLLFVLARWEAGESEPASR
jgi:cob(I)alamin adenosyltransferase